MNPESIIGLAKSEGVHLALSPTGTLRVAGDNTVVSRWLPILREQKLAIVKALLETDALTGDMAAIRLWLSHIGETDPAIIDEVLDKCRTDPDAMDYFAGRAGEVSK